MKDEAGKLKLAGWIVVVCLFFGNAAHFSHADEFQILTDMAGRQVRLKKPVRTIATTFKPASLCVFSLGLAQHLVGVDTSFHHDKLARRVYPDVTKITGIGNKTRGISFETLVSLKPEMVILYSQKDGLSLAGRLAVVDIPSIVIIPEDFDSIKTAMRLIAEAAGVSNRMAGIEEKMDQMLDLIEQRLSTLPEQDVKTAYFASSQGMFSTTTKNMLQHEIMTRAKIRNVSENLSGYFQKISPEQLVRWNPDIMILSQHIRKSEIQRLSDNILIPVAAVARKQVYLCPSSLAPWDFPSPLSVLASLWMAKTAYPDKFADVDIQQTADQFHKVLFNKTMTQMNGSVSDSVDF